MSGGYKAFLAEVNNLNKRMGDLRDINGESGAWARIMSGTGSAGGGFSDNYTHVQVGADNKHELDGLDLFTGVTMTYTDSHAGSDAFSGETKSVGAGPMPLPCLSPEHISTSSVSTFTMTTSIPQLSPALAPETTAPTHGMPVRKSVTVTM